MKLPSLSHLQIAVLGALVGGELKGREIRGELKQARVTHSGPAFYQMMARLEDAGFVAGWYEQKVVAGQIIKERRYRITPAGRRAWREARDFYARLIAAAEGAPARA
jgi:DNA-binding PadR family transcriptional regulator